LLAREPEPEREQYLRIIDVSLDQGLVRVAPKVRAIVLLVAEEFYDAVASGAASELTPEYLAKASKARKRMLNQWIGVGSDFYNMSGLVELFSLFRWVLGMLRMGIREDVIHGTIDTVRVMPRVSTRKLGRQPGKEETETGP
jgi:hypothetical protein